MRAYLIPLEGKYYGTEVAIVDDNGLEFIIKLWNSIGIPSVRECECAGITQDQWLDNPEYLEICDSHYESDATYNISEYDN